MTGPRAEWLAGTLPLPHTGERSIWPELGLELANCAGCTIVIGGSIVGRTTLCRRIACWDCGAPVDGVDFCAACEAAGAKVLP